MSIKEHPPQSKNSNDHISEENLRLHVPVLLKVSLDIIQPKERESYLDLTAGYGGHAGAFLDITKNYQNSVLVDRDDYAISKLSRFAELGVRLLSKDFVSAAQQLIQEGRKFDIVIVDLGVSSPQVDQSERGFSFTRSGPLDMRMDRRQTISAETLVNKLSEAELFNIITKFGEEPSWRARIIAKAIIGSRPLHSTGELATLIQSLFRSSHSKRHQATRTFQALRIAVNDELKLIEDLLPMLPRLLNKGGRVGVISFHSLEDRLVKLYLKEQQDNGLEAELDIITKKPLTGAKYDAHNPRARSSKLRVAVKK